MKHYSNLDLLLNELQNTVIDTVSTDPIGTKGRIIFNSTSNTLKYFNGTIWVSLGLQVSQFKGSYDASTNGVLPGNNFTLAGDFWIVITPGTQTGIIGNDFLEVGDLLYANVNSADQTPGNYFSIQTNTVAASESASGTVELASNTEALAGSNSLKAITPSSLSHVLNNNRYTQLFGDGTSTSYTITHNLNSLDVDITVFLVSTNEVILVNKTVVDTNTISLQVTPAPLLNGMKVKVSKP